MVPLFFLIQWKDEGVTKTVQLTNQYNSALTAGVQDGAFTMRMNSDANFESGYGTFKFNHVNKEEALSSFFETLNLNFGAAEPIGQDVLSRYVPVIGVIDYDGLHINAFDKYENEHGTTTWKRVWLPEIPFTYHDSTGNIIKFSIDEYVQVYDQALQKWVSGPRLEIAPQVTIPLLTAPNFEVIRRQVIVNTLQDQLAYYINEHNTYTRKLGINYTFALPTISQEDWNNSVSDISFFAFIQGVPLERDSIYNNYSFAGSRLTKTTNFFGSVVDGRKIYYRENKNCGTTYPIDEIFSSAKQAAKKGYSYKSCSRN